MTEALPTEDPGSGQEPQPQPAEPPSRPTGKSILRTALSVALIAVFAISLWQLAVRLAAPGSQASQPAATLLPSAAPGQGLDLATFKLPDLLLARRSGVARLAQVHTTLPTRPRFDLTHYTVQSGDTIYGIAEKFSLKPQTIMWGNTAKLGDNPDMIGPGLDLVILPDNGALHTWSKGESLKKVAEYYHVAPEDIIDWIGNHLTLEGVGDFANPNIAVGTQLFIPGGTREYTSKVDSIPRASPAVASFLGPGVCQAAVGNSMGTGTWVWPVQGTLTQGYLPDINHPAIDLGAPLGTPVVAADTGVVVYAGSTYDGIGFGNLVIIDHGNGWQTLYAHLSAIYVECGSGIYQGASLGAIGSTGHSSGPHLHFQMTSVDLGKVNPLKYLP
jgi:hypothetical protein